MSEQGKRVLVVDDSSMVRTIICRELREGGYTVIEAEDGLAALAKLAQSPVDLMTVDVEMPKLGGFELCRKLLDSEHSCAFPESRRVPIIFVTSNDTIKDRKRGFDLGAADFIIKPFPKGEILAAVTRILAPESRLEGLTALVVDDSPTARTIVSTALSREGLSIIEAEDGVQALAALGAHAHAIDIVVTDLVMPGLTGDELCRRARSELSLRDLPIILLTSANEQDRLLEVFKAGASDYIVKPFAREELLARLTVHLERAQLTKRLRETVKELSEAQKQAKTASEAKSAFLANMSHEIRTPMNAVIGLTDLALRVEMPLKVKDYLQKIRSSSHSLLGLINDILDFSKIEAGKLDLERTPFQLPDVLQSLVDLLAGSAAEKGIELIIRVAPDVPEGLVGDPLRLGQILINLANNAVKFTPGGEIIIRVDSVRRASGTTTLQFSVKDTGIGIDPERIPKLFESFTQADDSTTRKYGGTGLGLTICRRLATMMGGDIWVKSEKGKGSTFYLKAPFELQRGEPRPVAPACDLGSLKVLAVDDNASARELLEELLHSRFFETKSVASAEEGLKEIETALETKPYDLVLMDWKMPGMDGIEASRCIKQGKLFDGQRPKIIMLTAFGREEVMQQAERAGVDAFLIKPVNQSLLFDAIMSVFGAEAARGKLLVSGNISRAAPDTSLQGAVVLLVEDNAINQQVAGELLKQAGLVVHLANNGREAVEAVQKTDFDAVLMDIQMPEMDGYEATRVIRQDLGRKELPIIAMTAHAMAGDREKCLASGMDDHVVKPIDPDQLLKTLARWIKPGRAAVPQREAPASGDATELPAELPGIAVNVGLEKIGGNGGLFRKILLQFRAEFSSAAQEMENLIDRGEVDAAERLAHTLKGVSGNLGALDLHDVARELETAFRRGSADDFSGLRKSLDRRLKEVIESINLMEGKQRVTQPGLDPAIRIDRHQLDTFLTELACHLEQNDLVEDETIDTLRKHLSGTCLSSHVDLLETHIMNFDYESAMVQLNALREALGTLQ